MVVAPDPSWWSPDAPATADPAHRETALVLTLIDPPTTGVSGHDVPVRFTVRNISDNPVRGSWHRWSWLIADGRVRGGSDDRKLSKRNVDIEPGGEIADSWHLRLIHAWDDDTDPPGSAGPLPPGDYGLLVGVTLRPTYVSSDLLPFTVTGEGH